MADSTTSAGALIGGEIVGHKGIGTALLREAIAWSQQQDLELLIVWPSEEAARHYGRAGFVADNDVMELVLRDY
jgi:hypothetical protein